MANYPGYTPPSSITTPEQIKELQRQLNANGAKLDVDGKWGPQTSAAYTASGGTSSVIPAQYKNYLSELQTLLSPQKVAYTPTSEDQYRAQIQAALRPGYDQAITQRKSATNTNKAEIDADAAARGMGSSTWVTDVKDRQSGYEADDISTMEGQYNSQMMSALMTALQNEKANQLAVDQSNAELTANANSQALGLAGDFYSQYLSNLNGSGSGSGSKSKGSGWESYINELTPAERSEFFFGDSAEAQTYSAQAASELGPSFYAIMAGDASKRRYAQEAPDRAAAAAKAAAIKAEQEKKAALAREQRSADRRS